MVLICTIVCKIKFTLHAFCLLHIIILNFNNNVQFVMQFVIKGT